MRPYVVAVLLGAMMAVLVVTLAKRPKTDHVAPGYVATTTASAGDAGAGTGDARAGDALAGEAGDAKIEKTLRVASLGWDLLAPGVVQSEGATPNDKTAFSREIEVYLTNTEQPVKIEAMLARGGDDPDGVDVAIVPLPVLVAAYERLRALDPRMFLLVGWSHGREALVAPKDIDLAKLAGNDEAARQDVKLISQGNDASTMQALFAFELASVPSSKVKLLPLPNEKEKSDKSVAGAFLAIDRGAQAQADARKFLFTSADASRLLPLVAVAPRGVIERRKAALEAFARGWFEGMAKVRKDAPAAARRVAAVKGAPEAIALLERLGQIEPATLRDDTQAFALSGRLAVNLGKLFTRCFQLWRGVGVLTVPPPDEPPLDTTVVAELARTDSSLASAPGANKDVPPALPDPTVAAAPKATLLLTRRIEQVKGDKADKIDGEAIASELGFIAGVFEKATLRITVRGGLKGAKPIVIDARDRFSIAPGRLLVGDAQLGSAVAIIELYL